MRMRFRRLKILLWMCIDSIAIWNSRSVESEKQNILSVTEEMNDDSKDVGNSFKYLNYYMEKGFDFSG